MKSTIDYSKTGSLLAFRQTEICIIGQLGFVRQDGVLYIRYMTRKFNIGGK